MALFGKFKDLVGLEEYDEYDEITEEEIAETMESLDKPINIITSKRRSYTSFLLTVWNLS